MNMGGKGKQKQKGSNWFEEFQTNTKFKTQVTFKPCFQALWFSSLVKSWRDPGNKVVNESLSPQEQEWEKERLDQSYLHLPVYLCACFNNLKTITFNI